MVDQSHQQYRAQEDSSQDTEERENIKQHRIDSLQRLRGIGQGKKKRYIHKVEGHKNQTAEEIDDDINLLEDQEEYKEKVQAILEGNPIVTNGFVKDLQKTLNKMHLEKIDIPSSTILYSPCYNIYREQNRDNLRKYSLKEETPRNYDSSNDWAKLEDY